MFRERIQARYEKLTPSFRKIADFILQQPLDAAFMTATEMGHAIGVDMATVVRFAQGLDYEGFRELVKEIRQTIKAEMTASYTTALDAPNDLSLFRSLLENERHNLSLLQSRLNEQVNAVLPMLLEARHIWVVGQGSGVHLAALCAFSLRESGLPAMSIPAEPLHIAAHLNKVSDEDVVIGLALTGMALGVGDAIGFARQRGARTLVLSTSPVTAAARASEIAIVCPGQTQGYGPLFTGMAAMIAALVTALAIRYPEKAAEMKENMQQAYCELLKLEAHSSAEVNPQELWGEF